MLNEGNNDCQDYATPSNNCSSSKRRRRGGVPTRPKPAKRDAGAEERKTDAEGRKIEVVKRAEQDTVAEERKPEPTP